MRLNYMLFSGSSSEELGSVEYLFIAITPICTLTRSCWLVGFMFYRVSNLFGLFNAELNSKQFLSIYQSI